MLFRSPIPTLPCAHTHTHTHTIPDPPLAQPPSHHTPLQTPSPLLRQHTLTPEPQGQAGPEAEPVPERGPRPWRSPPACCPSEASQSTGSSSSPRTPLEKQAWTAAWTAPSHPLSLDTCRSVTHPPTQSSLPLKVLSLSHARTHTLPGWMMAHQATRQPRP